jgi:hypothetical protein
MPRTKGWCLLPRGSGEIGVTGWVMRRVPTNNKTALGIEIELRKGKEGGRRERGVGVGGELR